jgi:hypothetical protein
MALRLMPEAVAGEIESNGRDGSYLHPKIPKEAPWTDNWSKDKCCGPPAVPTVIEKEATYVEDWSATTSCKERREE